MINFRSFLNSLFNPESTNLKDGALDDILKALENPSVRRRWIENLVKDLWESNIRLDRLMEQNKDTEWKSISMRRNNIVFCLNEVIAAQDQLESELVEQERQNRIFESFKGVAASIDSRR